MRSVLGFMAFALLCYGLSTLVVLQDLLTGHWVGQALVLSLAFYAVMTVLLLPGREALRARGAKGGSIHVVQVLRAGLSPRRRRVAAWIAAMGALALLAPAVVALLNPYVGPARQWFLFAEIELWQECAWALGAASAFWLLHEVARASDVLEGLLPVPAGAEVIDNLPRRRRRAA